MGFRRCQGGSACHLQICSFWDTEATLRLFGSPFSNRTDEILVNINIVLALALHCVTERRYRSAWATCRVISDDDWKLQDLNIMKWYLFLSWLKRYGFSGTWLFRSGIRRFQATFLSVIIHDDRLP
jgi:hypothetical protein